MCLVLSVSHLYISRYGKVERVKKIKDYAFVHFEERDQAVEGENQFET